MARIKSLLAFVIVMGFAYACYVVGPPYFNNYQFQDDLKTEVRFLQNGGKSDDDIKAEVIKKALDENLTITPQQIKITRLNKTITVDVNYTVHVDMPGYSTDLDFHPTASNTLVM
jgi:hypothetical protein